MATIGVLGTGVVGRTLAARLSELGVDVMVGARTADSASLEPCAELGVRTGSFADAVAHADLILIATNGQHTLSALESVGAAALAGKTLVDISNELQPAEGGLPTPLAGPDNSLGQRIQAAFPEARVVKSLNTMNCLVMVDPSLVEGDHVVFLSGDDSEAKDRVREMLAAFGWRPEQMVDLGGIETAAAAEMLMPLWIRVLMTRNFEGTFNWAIHSG